MKQIILVLAITISTFGYAQNSEAKALLDEVSNKVKSYDNIYIEFDHKIDNIEVDMHQTANGSANLKGDLYNFKYMGVNQIFDGEKIYLIINEDEEVIIKKPNTEDGTTITPSKMLTFYEDGFTYNMDITQNIQGKKIQYVKLIPMDSESELKYILLGIDIKTKHIYKVIETGEDNTMTTYIITKFLTNQTISQSLFKFNRDTYSSYDITEPK